MANDSNTNKILIIIPAYNEESSIGEVIKSIRLELPKAEILVINDGSYDNTEKVAQGEGAKVITLPYNLGIGASEQTGFKYAYEKGIDIVIRIDADGQHDAKFIRTFIKEIQDNRIDMVIGSRYLLNEGFQSTFLRRIGIKWICLIIKLLTGYKFTDPTSGFRAVNKKLIKFFSKFYPTDYPEPESLLIALKSGYIVKEIPVIMKDRHIGISSINKWKVIYYMVKVPLALLVDETRFFRKRNRWIQD